MQSILYGKKGVRAGMTLMEMTFVMLIMVVILSAGIMTGGYVLREGDARVEILRIQEMASAVRLLKTQTGYPADSQIGPKLAEMGLIPQNHAHNNGRNVQNSFGGQINFRRLGNGGFFGLEYTNIPQSECRLIAHQIASEYIRAVGKSASTLKLVNALDADDIAQMCKNSTNTLIFASDVP